jgi:hypothetical protein
MSHHSVTLPTQLNVRRVFGGLAGLVILAGVSLHQVKDNGSTPADVALMSGTAVYGQAIRHTDARPGDRASCAGAEYADGEPDAAADCSDQTLR